MHAYIDVHVTKTRNFTPILSLIIVADCIRCYVYYLPYNCYCPIATYCPNFFYIKMAFNLSDENVDAIIRCEEENEANPLSKDG